MTGPASQPKARSRRGMLVRGAVGILFGGFLTWLSFHSIKTGELLSALGRLRFEWVGAGMLIYALDIGLRVQRWRLLLRPLARLSYRKVAESLIVGYAANNILPARLGELFRADFLKRQNGVSRAGAIASILVERLCDGILVMLCLTLGLHFVMGSTQPGGLLDRIAWASAVLFGSVLVVTLAVSVSGRHLRLVPWPWLRHRLEDLAETLAGARHVLFQVVLLSLVIWLCEAAVFGAILRAVSVPTDAAEMLLVAGVVSLSTLLPSAPGYAGSYEFAFVIALAAFHQPSAPAVLAAVLIQIFLLGVLTLIGGGLLIRHHVSLLEAEA